MSVLKRFSTILSNSAITLGLLILPFCSYANPGDPGGDPDGIPVDGGASLLIAAGAAYGAKKLRDHRKKSKTRP